MTQDEMDAIVEEYKNLKKINIVVQQLHGSMHVDGPFATLYDAEQWALRCCKEGQPPVFAMQIPAEGPLRSIGIISVEELKNRNVLQPCAS